MPDSVLAALRAHIDQIRRDYDVKQLLVFGSSVRPGAKSHQDVDVAVEFEGEPTFDRFMDLKFHLEDLLQTRVDLTTRRAIRPELRADIEREAVHVP